MFRDEKEMSDYIYQFEADIFNDKLIEDPKSYYTGELKNENCGIYQFLGENNNEYYGEYD